LLPRLVAVLVISFTASQAFADERPDVDFAKQIRPILNTHCVECHGPEKHKAGLRLDVKALAMKGGDDGPILVAGKSGDSPMVQRIVSDDPEKRMPPKGDRLTVGQVAVIRRWIDGGAVWEETPAEIAAARDKRLDHWAWRAIKPTRIPSTSPPAANPIDAFVLKKLNDAGLQPLPEAEAQTILRRLYFDLIGLPPKAEDVAAFKVDFTPGNHDAAVAKWVDRLLASPQYGERWARHWLDIAHYADTHGFERDKRRDNAWRYRDWVIRSLNSDLRYDLFLRLQIAGDAIQPDAPDAVIATGFLTAGPWDFVGQAETPSPVLKRLARADDLDDMVTQVISGACGVTINCARCHDHKLDPISQKEYYSLISVFAGAKRGDRAISPSQERQFSERRVKLGWNLAAVRLAQARAVVRPWRSQAVLDALREEWGDIAASLKEIAEPAKVYAIVSEKPPAVRVQHRGNPEDPRDAVAPGAIACLDGLKPMLGDDALTDPERRKALATWDTDPANPHTRRVIVNRLWHHHFGVGIVETPSDFGLGGGKPSHPELLDYLADRLLKENWSLKAMHRLICTSAAYRRASTPASSQAMTRDSGNRLLWRGPTRRIDAESLRDSVLAVSGKLNPDMYGPGWRDFDYKEEYAPVYTYKTADAPDLWRRSIYRFIVRTTPHQLMTTLDCPNPANLTPARNITTTALQSLTLLNNQFMLRQAGYFAERVKAEAGADPKAQARRAFAIAFARDATDTETSDAAALIQSHGLPELCRMLLNANEFVYVD
jgi:mono/diheme cytochrome c family protein